ncbi:DMT family transporter [Echinimonas agarilytica]|uniref:SMR family transporter n=1 Tax=Echinimonas agarilytica TaxID=1215918 RepID=A0AA41W729_9GAMM|nr:SMR family transporter [Echinimonas agarilytica]MCM2680044.1 SMR family transporter [Echinimonas agarilytica]
MSYALLASAILIEVIATVMLKASNGWQNIWLGSASVAFFSLSGVLLGFVLKDMSVGLAYTIWSGVGVALICGLSALLWHQKLDIYATSGIAMIVIGTVLITAKSKVLLP